MNKTSKKPEEFYTPGVCNINPPEVAYRKKVGMFLGYASIAVIILSIIFAAPVIVSALVFILVFLSAVSLLQAKNSFCVAYAASGKFNSSDEYAATQEVKDAENRRKDKKKANKLYIQSAVIALLVSVVAAVILNIR